ERTQAHGRVSVRRRTTKSGVKGGRRSERLIVPANAYPVKTNKKGEFTFDGEKETPLLGKLAKTVDVTAKLKEPKDITVEGTFTFNGNANKFKVKTGATTKFSKLPLAGEKAKHLNKVKLMGTTDPVQADKKLVFEVDFSIL
ncbi:MAG: hypothetical protein L0Y71_03530, partial [Gemmataceae bacterium]|nr:hypothetical protein [Gemmataceae bacterium]